MRRAVARWRAELVDTTARNNLLYFRDLKVGTLDLSAVSSDLLFRVLGGKAISVSRLFSDGEAIEDATKRCRALYKKAQEHFEERGLQTLYLAFGTATWTNEGSASVPRAPVLLVPAQLKPKGASRTDFELSVTGELEVNPTLLQLLRTEFNCLIDPDTLIERAGIEGALDTPAELDIALNWMRENARAVPGFSVSEAILLGNFSYAKLPMVQDLERSDEALVEHDLIAALAGDRDAQARISARQVEIDITQPDATPPADEFLVLDADSSQNYAINAILAGQDLVIKGPPGTGKSQTIANLITTLVARGRRVLFVAEKRAAIDAVLQRLDSVGLADVALDLHGGVSSRKKIAEALSQVLSTNSSLTARDYTAELQLLDTRRQQLNAHARALHQQRDPWGVSLFDVFVRLAGLRDVTDPQHRFRGDQLRQLDNEAFRSVSENLRELSGLGGISLDSSGSPWARSPINSSDEVQETHELLTHLSQHLPDTIASLQAAADQAGLSAPDKISGWHSRLGLWEQVQETLKGFRSEVYEPGLDTVVASLQPLNAGAASRAVASLTSSGFRQARKWAQTLAVSPMEGRAILSGLHAALDQNANWSKLASDGSVPSVPENLTDLRSAFNELQGELARAAAKAGRTDLDGTPESVQQEVNSLLGDSTTLSRLPRISELRSSLDSHSLSAFYNAEQLRARSAEQITRTFELVWLLSILDHVNLTDPDVNGFNGSQLLQTVVDFKKADNRHIHLTASRVRRKAAEAAVSVQNTYPEQTQLVKAEALKKRRHKPTRDLFKAAPDVLTALKPCWAMSPLVVSQLLPSDRQYFDVVVFDEASQVRPADAIPALLRGARSVVAGDERQLPPTTFFAGSDPDEESEDEETIEELDTGISLDGGFDNILEGLLPFIGFKMLAWHYRSRDEKLIAFSNVHVYDRGMTTFPGSGGQDAISHVLVPFDPDDLNSDLSSSAEVRAVVDLILDHARNRPDESLGVIAMGIKHADRIDGELRRRLQERRDFEDFFDETKKEKFFVKNLERVQGDERDAIILSVGYGKNHEGRMMYRFGPINQEGGERRLNVAITRAKSRMTVVSSFSSNDLDPDKTRSRGADLLRQYIAYAESAGHNLGERAHEIPELNPFEVDVRDTLERAGIPLTAQYGASGYKIDYAAKHPDQPGRMVLAIECDGMTYHSSPTARDRDRLRQQHLENLGWRFHRIWSQDWFHDKATETEKAVAAYHAAVVAADQRSADETDPTPAAPPAGEPIAAPARGPFPSDVPLGLPITEYEDEELWAVVRWVKSDTRLRTDDDLLVEVMRALGFQKRGSRIAQRIGRAIADVNAQDHE